MTEGSDSFRFSPISLLLLGTVHSLDACRANTSRQKRNKRNKKKGEGGEKKEKEKRKRSLCCKYNFICTSREMRCVRKWLSEHAIGHVRPRTTPSSRLPLTQWKIYYPSVRSGADLFNRPCDGNRYILKQPSSSSWLLHFSVALIYIWIWPNNDEKFKILMAPDVRRCVRAVPLLSTRCRNREKRENGISIHRGRSQGYERGKNEFAGENKGEL